MTGFSNWSLTTYRDAGSGPDRAGIKLSDGRIVQPDLLARYAGLCEAIDDWDTIAPALQALDVSACPVVESAVELNALRYPRKLICAGANYTDHIAEMGAGGMPDGADPFFFLLPASTTLIASGETVYIPADASAKVDWEAELAVVIGRRATRISKEEAHRHVAGYACFNDITARGYHRREISLAPPFAFDWCGSKGLDGFCPMGAIVPAWAVPDPAALSLRCRVNGELRQDGRTANMIYDIWELIAFASRFWTLEPGDVIATGTPAGVGARTGTFLKPGDEVVVEIEGFPSVRNRIEARSTVLANDEPGADDARAAVA